MLCTGASQQERALPSLQAVGSVPFPRQTSPPYCSAWPLTACPVVEQHEEKAVPHTPRRLFGMIISFDVRCGAPAADAVCAGLQLIQTATSLGAVESTIETRARAGAGAPAALAFAV